MREEMRKRLSKKLLVTNIISENENFLNSVW